MRRRGLLETAQQTRVPENRNFRTLRIPAEHLDQREMRPPGFEPGQAAWKAAVIAIRPQARWVKEP